MAVTKTTRLNLAKQALGDLNWRVALDQGFDDADDRFFLEGTGSPAGLVTAQYVGQRYYQTDAEIGFEWWTANATGTAGWLNDTVVNYGTKATRDAIATPITGQLFFRSDVDPGAVDRYNGAAWARVLGPRVGQIEIWSGSILTTANYLDARPGWALCDGTLVNGFQTPDLVDKFVRGTATDLEVETTGGADSALLTLEEMPPHRHHLARNDTIGETATLQADELVSNNKQGGSNPRNYELAGDVTPATDEASLGLVGPPTGADSPWADQGAQTAVSRLPAYMALAYIVFVDVA